MQIDDRFTCPDAPLSPPEEEEDTTPYCRNCGEPHSYTYRDRADGTVYGCEYCIIQLVAAETEYIDGTEYIDCPECKSEAERVYMDCSSGKIVGCDNCVEVVDAE